MDTLITPQASAGGQPFDQGTAYGRKIHAHDPLLTEVGPGTPMGELLRRYWQPVEASDRLQDLPLRVRLLGEDLVLFRDGRGRAGLVVEHCAHRGTSLFYGRIEEDGIRCPYHGWKFDVQGHCIEQACEPGGGQHRAAGRQPWYPVQERYGTVWAYMGPPDRKPVLPRWAPLDGLQDGETYVIRGAAYGPPEGLDFNWLQSYENIVDPLHAVWLHIMHSEENQFGAEPGYQPGLDTTAFIQHTKWSDTDRGVRFEQVFPMGDGRGYHYSVENILPNASIVPYPVTGALDNVIFHVPIDDTHWRAFVITRAKDPGEVEARGAKHRGKWWRDCTPEELQRYPGDYETQSTQGPITVHAHEHLAQTDRGVVLTRRRLRQLVEDVRAGKDPLNVSFDPDAWLSSVAYAFVDAMGAGSER
jgi:nitrite reductase/ring-hydroxylating ferredoxin subunit